MQGDLISRSALIELLRNNTSNDIQDQIITENNINLIMSIPTAYSVEDVVAELERKELDSCSAKAEAVIGMLGVMADIHTGEIKAYKEAIEIVRNGGKE